MAARIPRVTRTCPVCDTDFEVLPRDKKVTCTRKCSNTHFRSGPNNGNWSEKMYRTTCFHFHGKKCIVCGEENVVEAHHIDKNRSNNDPSNLMPLCPTHHQYVHSRYRYLIEDKLQDFLNASVR